MSFKDEIKGAAHRAPGVSFETRKARQNHGAKFADFLKNSNVQIKKVDHVKAKHIADFVAHRLGQGASLRTMQNEVSSLRGVLRAEGRGQLASLDAISNKNLRISGASRNGTKTAISPEQAQKLKGAIQSPGARAGADLQDTLGLRRREVVMSAGSLQTWARALANGEPLRITNGTKGGRPRWVEIHDKAGALESVKRALVVVRSQGGKLIDKPDLLKAKNSYSYEMKKAGFVGVSSNHALRYSFARSQFEGYLDKGLTEKEALSATSLDLGHGEGRTDYVKQVYLR